MNKLESAQKIVEQEGKCRNIHCGECFLNDSIDCQYSLDKYYNRLKAAKEYIKNNESKIKPHKIKEYPPKEKEVKKPIFGSEEECKKFLETVGLPLVYLSQSVEFCKEEGYIKKSALENARDEYKHREEMSNPMRIVFSDWLIDELEKEVERLQNNER